MQTLNEIATSYGVSLQTVYNWKSTVEDIQGRKIEGSSHPNDGRKVVYSAEAVALITEGRQPITSAVEVTIETGNHCTTLATTSYQGQTYDLATFRDPQTEALVLDDPAAAADEFLAVADNLVGAMQQDITARQQRLQQTQQAQQRVAAKAQELQFESRLYRAQAQTLDQQQTATSQQLGETLQALQAMGKPAGGDGAA